MIKSKDTNVIYEELFMLKVKELQVKLITYEEFSKPISYIEFVKYANQAYNNDKQGNYYDLPQKINLPRLRSMLIKSEEINSLDITLTDEINSKARISLRMHDLSTPDNNIKSGGKKSKSKVLKSTKALLEGHFILSSGLHSNKYVQCAKLLSFAKTSSNGYFWIINEHPLN